MSHQNDKIQIPHPMLVNIIIYDHIFEYHSNLKHNINNLISCAIQIYHSHSHNPQKSINSADSINTCPENEMSPSSNHSNVKSPFSIFSPTSRQNVTDLERSFRDDRQRKLRNKFTKNKNRNKPKIPKPMPLPLNNRVLSHSIDEEQEIEMEMQMQMHLKGTSICDDDGKGLILNLPSSMIFDEELRTLNGDKHRRTISRTLECGLEHVLKEQNDLLRQLSVDHDTDIKDNHNYINRNYYYEDYHDSEQEMEQYID